MQLPVVYDDEVHYLSIAYSASNFIRDSVTVLDFYSRILHGVEKRTAFLHSVKCR